MGRWASELDKMERKLMQDAETLVTFTAEIVAAHVSNNKVAIGDLAELISSVHASFAGLNANTDEPEPAKEPAVSIRASIKPDYLVCLEDGKKMKMLKRYLMGKFGLTPDEYRAKWGLPSDYPMVAPSYRERRSVIAKQTGLGSKGRGPVKASMLK